MAIVIRSNGRISGPFLSTGSVTAVLAVRETGPGGAPKARPSDPDVRPEQRSVYNAGPSSLEELMLPDATAP